MSSRVIFVNRFFYPDYSATSQLLTDLSEALSLKGVPVIVVTGRYRYDSSQLDDPLPASEMVKGLRVFRCWSSKFGRRHLLGRAIDYLTFYIAINFRLFMLARRGDVVVAMTDPPMLGAALLVPIKLRRAKLVNWIQDLFPELAEELGVRALPRIVMRGLRAIRDKSCQAACNNVVIGRRLGRYLEASGVDPDRIKMVANWAPCGLEAADRDNPFRDKWGLSGYFVVAYSGNLGRAHDWSTIFEAAALLAADSRIRFLMIGGGAGMDALREAVSSAGLDNVVFQPYQPRDMLAQSLSVPDVHLVSLQSGVSDYLVPSKIYGIAAVGRPAIFVGSRNSEIADLLSEHCFGKAVPNGEARQLAGEIIRYAESGEEYARACANALTAHGGYFAMQQALDAWLQVLAELGATPDPVPNRPELNAPR